MNLRRQTSVVVDRAPHSGDGLATKIGLVQFPPFDDMVTFAMRWTAAFLERGYSWRCLSELRASSCSCLAERLGRCCQLTIVT